MTENYANSLYESVESALTLMNCDIGPAECHGMLCGMLCGVQTFDPGMWLGHATGYDEDFRFDDLGAGHALKQLLEETLSGFDSDDFALQVLVPEDDYPMETRTAALGAWCRGFLSGFGFSEITDLAQLSEDSRGYLRDLQEISRVDPEIAGKNDDEYSLMELCEYARMGALLLREETLFANAAPGTSGTIH